MHVEEMRRVREDYPNGWIPALLARENALPVELRG
jgi:hypothetical protein